MESIEVVKWRTVPPPRPYLMGLQPAEQLKEAPVLHCIKVLCSYEVVRDKLGPNVIVRKAVINAKVFNPGGKAFVQPQMCPPFLHQA